MKRVRFSKDSPSIRRRSILITPQEREKYWHSKKDFAENLKDTKQTLRALRRVNGNVGELDANRFCTRGLEKYWSMPLKLQTRASQITVIRVVLEEQRLQCALGIKDPIGLCEKATPWSDWARQRAQEQALHDQEHVRLQQSQQQQQQQQHAITTTTEVESNHHPQEVVSHSNNNNNNISATITATASCATQQQQQPTMEKQSDPLVQEKPPSPGGGTVSGNWTHHSPLAAFSVLDR
eukprot:CAMPEP_0116855164 /NCGR_PEP_ID=MMETSP0418-20121206/19086_1 /TAXON_ID=1158023 /ORGANISM="Astrosyne radiata, Strain 13vi08-1A" /LENGTH=236 /DNA_ID=CAMNT_0004488187 /DNA_START=24 /DNA_END=734 /DNA_ORIENTATION=+